MTLTLLSPVQEATQLAFARAPRLSSLEGMTLGLYSNGKLNATRLLDLIADELAADFRFERHLGTYHVHLVMEPAEWGELDKCDAVILANGDCGACSSSGIANAIEVEKRGIPCMLVSTPPFTEAVTTMARLSGLAAIEWAIVEHPIGSADDAAVRERARDAAAQFRRIILATIAAAQAA